MNKRTKYSIVYLIASVLMVLLDQFTKSLAVSKLKGKEAYVVIKKIFEFDYVENPGAAFSSFLGKQGFLLTVTAIIMVFIIWKWFCIPTEKRFTLFRISFALLISGAVGNMIDRVRQSYVVDFIYFVPINFPKFNVADCYVCISMILLAVSVLFVYKDEETDFLFHIRKK